MKKSLIVGFSVLTSVIVGLALALGVVSAKLSHRGDDLAQSRADLQQSQSERARLSTKVATLEATVVSSSKKIVELEAEVAKREGAMWAEYYETKALVATLGSLITPGTMFEVREGPWGPVTIMEREDGMLGIEVSRPWPSTVRPSSGGFDKNGNYIGPTYGHGWNVPALGEVKVVTPK